MTGTHLPYSSDDRVHGRFRLVHAIVGLAALAWFLLRVIPKPSRAAYPCQRVAFPLASSFVLWVAGVAGALFAFRRARALLDRDRHVIAAACALAGVVLAVVWGLSLPREQAFGAWTPADPPNSPIGVPRGIRPGRVVWAHDPEATSWDGSSGNWWSASSTDRDLVDRMMSRAVRALAGEETDAAAWDAIFRHFNRTRVGGDGPGPDVGYASGEGLAIKVNMNVAASYAATNAPIVSPQALGALLAQLVREAGIPESAISVYDASRCLSDPLYDPCHAEFPAVRFVDNRGLDGRERVARDPDVPVFYSGPGAGASGTTRLPSCVVDAKYLINLALLRGHTLAGVTLCGKNHFGSVWRPDTATDGGWKPDNLHGPVSKNLPMGSYSCLVDLMGHESLGGKTLLYMIDALYAAVTQGSASPARWTSSPFDGDWTSSLFLSQDGVAIDSVALDFCRAEPILASAVSGTGVDNYLHEAALADDPPSGTSYDPEGDGSRLPSQGVHEHWDDPETRRYSRNLGTGVGIELVRISSGTPFIRGDANADGRADISDAVSILLHLFLGGNVSCESSADADDSGDLAITDAIHILRALFSDGAPVPGPSPGCGTDPTPDALSCAAHAPCAPARPVDLVTTGTGTGTGTMASFLVPEDGSLGLSWTQVAFDDSAWTEGRLAVGYDGQETYRPFIETDLLGAMSGVSATVYIRIPFGLQSAVADPDSVEEVVLWMQYDDGFVAYLNGSKIADRNAPGTPTWSASATRSNDDAAAVAFEKVALTGAEKLLLRGKNVLAIHGLNASAASSDFLIGAKLQAKIR